MDRGKRSFNRLPRTRWNGCAVRPFGHLSVYGINNSIKGEKVSGTFIVLKRAGDPVAGVVKGRVVLIPPSQIKV